MTTRGVSFKFWPTLWAGASTLPIALAAGAVAFGARELLLRTDLPTFLRLVVVGMVMLTAYVALLLLVAPSLVRDIKDILRRRTDDGSPPGHSGGSSSPVATGATQNPG